MIEIYLYNNGVKVEGHSQPIICGGVSALTWNLANNLSYHIIDKESYYYSSSDDNKSNPYEGLTILTLDTENEDSLEQLEWYRHNIKIFVKGCKYESEVKIHEIEGTLEVGDID